MSIPYTNELDLVTHKWVSISNLFFEEKIKPTPDEIIFIDVSKSRYLIPTNVDSSENDIVVNRKYLAKLFRHINENNNEVKYIFSDIIFDIPTIDDDSLIYSVNAIGNKISCINTYDSEELFQPNIFGFPSATATIAIEEGVIHKIPFLGKFGDTILPIKIYKDLHNVNFKVYNFFTWFENKGLSFNSQINYHYLRKNDFINGDYVKIGLGEIVSLIDVSPNIFSQFLKNRYILIGDFENDKIETYLNEQPGTLVLFDAYLHLKAENQILSIWYLISLYLFIYYLLWLHFTNKELKILLSIKIKYLNKIIIPVNIVSITFLLFIYSFISYFLFGIYISLFHLIAIFSIIEFFQFFINKIDDNQKK